MSITSTASIPLLRNIRRWSSRFPTRDTLAVVATLSIFFASTRGADAQTVPPEPAWEFRVSSGALVPTGAEREVLKDAALTVAQLSYVVRPPFAITGAFGWARSRDRAFGSDPKVDVFTYDLGVEARAPRWIAHRSVTLSPFVGVGGGARSYNYRTLAFDATHSVG